VIELLDTIFGFRLRFQPRTSARSVLKGISA
jgi:hypothetical protein